MSIHTILSQEIEKIKESYIQAYIKGLGDQADSYYGRMLIEANKKDQEFLEKVLRQFATRIVEEAQREERERIKKAFWEEFRGSGELWFTYEAMGSTEDEINEPVEEHWNSIIENCTNLQKMKEI